jgi:hypothetical protein
MLYEENYRLVQNWVKGFDANAMEYRDVSKVYIHPELLKLAKEKASK